MPPEIGILALVLLDVQLQRDAHLMQVVLAGRGTGLGLGFGDRWEQEGSQDTYNGDDHQEFDQGETASVKWA